jgi:hypothetical protein
MGIEDHFIEAKESAIVTLTSGTDNITGSLFDHSLTSAPGTLGQHYPWGDDNQAPQNMLKLAAANPIKMQILNTRKNILLGQNLALKKRVLKDGNWIFVDHDGLSMVEDAFEELNVQQYLHKAAFDLEFSHNFFLNISFGGNRKVNALTVFDSTVVRAERMNQKTGKIEYYHINPDWARLGQQHTAMVPAFNKKTAEGSNAETIWHGRDHTPGQPYYDYAPWWGTKEWTELSNLIPTYHKNGLKNGYNIKYHIKIPQDYFKKFGDDAAQKKQRLEFYDRLKAFLNGEGEKDKAFVSEFATDHETGKVMPGFEIIALPVQMTDKAFTELFTVANSTQAAGHGLSLALASVSDGTNFGASGSELRSALVNHIAIHTPTKRKLLLEPLYAIKKINKWPADLYFAFEDLLPGNLDGQPSGSRMDTNQKRNAI